MKLGRKTITALAALAALGSSFLFLNLTLLPTQYEVPYVVGTGKPLSSFVNAASGTSSTKKVEIPANQIAYLDQDVDVDQLIISGQLHCDYRITKNIEIKARVIFVGGVFQCGTATRRQTSKVTIALKDSGMDAYANAAVRALMVHHGGKLILTGRKERAGWVKLNSTLEVGDDHIVLDRPVNTSTNSWKIGDEIVIGPTSYDPNEAETFLIRSIDPSDARIVYLDRTAKYRHWGSIERHQTGLLSNFVLDERAEVANLTRNIVIRADESLARISETNEKYSQIGGHVMVHMGGFAAVDAVEFSRLGQAGIMARYPFHWHLAGNAAGQFVQNSSIHRSFQRCITIHGTNQTLVKNNVCYDFKGHGFFYEDSSEIDNVLEGNLAINARLPSNGKYLLASDNPNGALSGVNPIRFAAVSSFWIANPRNTIRGNVASGSAGTGFWMSYASDMPTFNPSSGRYDGPLMSPQPVVTNTKEFSNNVAHTAIVGHTWDGAPVFRPEYDMKNPNNSFDRKLAPAHYSPSVTPVFSGLVAYKNRNTGIYFRGDTAVFTNSVMADNGVSIFLAYNQIVRDSLVVGRSKNTSPTDSKFLTKQFGAYVYDGPFELDKVAFHSFSTAKESILVNGVNKDVTTSVFTPLVGTEKYTNTVKRLTFKPEPLHRMYIDDDTPTSRPDFIGNTTIRDLDGSLTGVAGGLLVGARAMSTVSSSGCTADGTRFYNAKVCPASFTESTLNFFNVNTGTPWVVPHVVRRSDGFLSHEMGNWAALFSSKLSGNTKFSLTNSSGYEYEVLLKDAPEVQVWATADRTDGRVSVVKLPSYGRNCRLDGAQAVSSVTALRSATVSAYHSSGNNLYIRLKANQPFPFIKPNTYGTAKAYASERFIIRCDGAAVAKVKGNIDKAVVDSATSGSPLVVSGWACDFARDAKIAVRLYAGGPPGRGGVLLQSATANLNPDAAKSFACGVPSSNGFGYRISIPQSVAAQHNGKRIFVEGVSSSGGSNLTLGGSGSYLITCLNGSCKFDLQYYTSP